MPWLRKRAPRYRDPLDQTLLDWTGADPYTLRHLLAGGLHAFGASGSGKTSSLWVLADALLEAGAALLVCCPKSSDRRAWEDRCRRAGRERDVLVIDSKSNHCLNLIAYEATRPGAGGGQVANVVRLLMELRAVVMRESDGGGGDGQMWRRQDERLLTHLTTLLLLAGEPPTADALHALLLDLPDSAERLKSADWQAGVCNRVCAAAYGRVKTETEAHDGRLALDFVLKEWPSLSDRTRASVLIGSSAVVSALNSSTAWSLFGRDTTFTPHEAIESRKIVIVDLPPDEWGVAGLVANVGLKHLFQQAILRRQVSADSPPAVLWCDEASLFVTTPGDAQFLSRCRSARGAMVYIAQSLGSYKEVLPADKADAAVDALLGNFSHKLLFAVGDHPTALWAADLCGKALRTMTGGGVQHAPASWADSPSPQQSSSFHDHLEHRLLPGEFLSGFRTGGPAHRRQVDAVLIRTAEPFSNAKPFVRVTFTQPD